MAGPPDPAPPPGTAAPLPGASPSPAPPEAARAEGQPMRYGPLLLFRYRKDDGRTLILYAEDGNGGGVARG